MTVEIVITGEAGYLRKMCQGWSGLFLDDVEVMLGTNVDEKSREQLAFTVRVLVLTVTSFLIQQHIQIRQ